MLSATGRHLGWSGSSSRRSRAFGKARRSDWTKASYSPPTPRYGPTRATRIGLFGDMLRREIRDQERPVVIGELARGFAERDDTARARCPGAHHVVGQSERNLRAREIKPAPTAPAFLRI